MMTMTTRTAFASIHRRSTLSEQSASRPPKESDRQARSSKPWSLTLAAISALAGSIAIFAKPTVADAVRQVSRITSAKCDAGAAGLSLVLYTSSPTTCSAGCNPGTTTFTSSQCLSGGSGDATTPADALAAAFFDATTPYVGFIQYVDSDCALGEASAVFVSIAGSSCIPDGAGGSYTASLSLTTRAAVSVYDTSDCSQGPRVREIGTPGACVAGKRYFVVKPDGVMVVNVGLSPPGLPTATTSTPTTTTAATVTGTLTGPSPTTATTTTVPLPASSSPSSAPSSSPASSKQSTKSSKSKSSSSSASPTSSSASSSSNAAIFNTSQFTTIPTTTTATTTPATSTKSPILNTSELTATKPAITTTATASSVSSTDYFAGTQTSSVPAWTTASAATATDTVTADGRVLYSTAQRDEWCPLLGTAAAAFALAVALLV
ncbi:hypothetical protein DFJ73DRAFT_150071 [Zopfochytrium polystomum]|nr:hypothetical protein DFJ73DRAFT_150071 [Zopfochytrium polystomum]